MSTQSTMEHVRYIDKTRDYYRKAGYSQDYQWASFDDGPFTPLTKPLSASRAMLVSTASLVRVDESGQPTEPARMLGSTALEVFPLASDTPTERLRSTSEDHDRFQTDMRDINAYFPLSRLAELVREGRLGSLAREFLRILPNYSKRKVLTVDAPDVLRRCRDDAIDVVLLTPI